MDECFKEIYQEERNKLSQLPCGDDDFIAYENAINKYNKERGIHMENIVWEEAKQNECSIENGIQTMAFNKRDQIIGYNGIVIGDKVKYKDKEYTVVMASTMGDFGLSETGKLPYIMRISPSEVEKVQM